MIITPKLNNNSNITNELVLFANELADISEKILQKYFRHDQVKIFDKEDQTPVTIADTEVESAIRAAIEKKYPEHNIAGEEFGSLEGNSPYKWFIDPIDGTSSFIMGRPLFTTLIALTYNSEAIYGLINQPITKERWQGGEIYQANFNGINIKTRNTENISDAVLATTSPYLFNDKQNEQFNKLRHATKYQPYGGVFLGGDAYLYATLASGYVDIIMESDLKPHDFMALVPIIKAAGGVITDWKGNDIDENSAGDVIACCSKKLHKKVLSEYLI